MNVERTRQAVVAARELLEADGPAALSMRRLADRIGIRAPSLYKHFPDKATLETALIAEGMAELAEALEGIGDGDLPGLCAAYRAYALAHPHLYRLMTERPLPRAELPAGLEDRTAAPLVRAVGGDGDRARAAWAFAHGMVMLELNGRFPPGADLTGAWQSGTAAFA